MTTEHLNLPATDAANWIWLNQKHTIFLTVLTELIHDQRKQAVEDFASKILHGDEQHKAWLLEAAAAYSKGEPLPVAGVSAKALRLAELEAERDRFKTETNLLDRMLETGGKIIHYHPAEAYKEALKTVECQLRLKGYDSTTSCELRVIEKALQGGLS